MKISNPISTHGQLGSVTANQHHNETHALTAAAHTGVINDTQHGTRTEANAHAHSALSGAAGAFGDHTITAVEIAHMILYT